VRRTTLLTDHPGWTLRPGDATVRLLAGPSGTWHARWADNRMEFTALDDAASVSRKPGLYRAEREELPRLLPPSMAGALVTLGTVLRLPNPDLWDAITTQILRWTVRGLHARTVYEKWATVHGRTYQTPDGPISAVPRPEVIDDLVPVGGGSPSKAPPHVGFLVEAARAYTEHGSRWERMSPDTLAVALRKVPGLGPISAGRAAADFTGDFTVHPAGDPVLRYWAQAAVGDTRLPSSPGAFETLWNIYAPGRSQLHALTTFTLAWGIHARCPPHGSPDDPMPERSLVAAPLPSNSASVSAAPDGSADELANHTCAPQRSCQTQ
jgi:hypothetical protein